MQRDGCFRGSSIMLKEKITFWAPFSCNWHRRLRVPAVDELQERVDKRKTGKHARSPAVKNTLLLPKGWKPIPKRVRDWEWERGAVAFFWQPVQCGSCEAWEHLCVSLCPPSPSSLHPSRSPFLSLSHRQGRSFSVCAHIPLGQHHLESTDTALIELAEGSSFSERMIALKGLHRLSSARSKEGEKVKAFQPRLLE